MKRKNPDTYSIKQPLVRRRFLKALREQAQTNPAIERAEAVYLWASHLTAETRYTSPERLKDYYITEAARSLHFELKHMEDGLIGVVGLQGIGKTSTLQKLAYDLDTKETPAIFIRWVPDWQKIIEENPKIKDSYKRQVAGILYEKEEAYGRTFRRMPSLGGKVPDLVDLGQIERGKLSLETMEAALGRIECRKAMEEAVFWTLVYTRFIFIDLPDYGKKARGDMFRDLRLIENLWKRVTEKGEMNHIFLIGIQKEMFGGHFFFGKMHIVTLPPMKIEEMLAAYKKKWMTAEPFTEEALSLIAGLSRGIFRRFLKYIQKCIVDTITKKREFPISVQTVKEGITLEVLNADMDLELTELFQNNKEQKVLAVKILSLLRERKLNQSETAKLLDTSEATVSRVVKKLEVYGYLKRERGQHGEWILMLT
jgi:predicted XRE-type DNA-binding protein